jgi:hypothetical protein
MSLREVARVGARYTWTNKQLNPVRCVLDRVFVSPAWEASFPLCTLTAITRIGSDHTPLLLCRGDATVSRPSRFMFQTWWFEVPDFVGTVWGKLEGSLLTWDRSEVVSMPGCRWQGVLDSFFGAGGPIWVRRNVSSGVPSWPR